MMRSDACTVANKAPITNFKDAIEDSQKFVRFCELVVANSRPKSSKIPE